MVPDVSEVLRPVGEHQGRIVSGFVRGPRFDLTWTKALYWHRFCDCGAETLVSIYTAHLQEQGYVRHYHSSVSVLSLSRADLTPANGTEDLYAAVAGTRKRPLPL